LNIELEQLMYMDKKNELRISERILIWMHNESEIQKFTEDNTHDIPETVVKVTKLKHLKILP
jgi:hypothetical protein